MWSRPIAILAIIAVLAGTTTASAQSGPTPGPAVAQMPDPVRARCTTCHGEDLIRQQRLSRGGWEREIDKMIRWGAVVPAVERDLFLQYFVASSGPSSTSSATPSRTDRGAEVYSERCLGCHGSDLIEQQRLGPAGWEREVEKMIRWGAQVDPADRMPLVAYLTSRPVTR
jgi:cytochrome c5